MVHPAISQFPPIPQVMPVALNPHFFLESLAFVAALEAQTQFANEFKKVVPVVNKLNADLFRRPVKFPDQPFPVTIQLVPQVVALSHPSYHPNSQPAFSNIPQDTPIPQPNPHPCPETHGLNTSALGTHEIAMSTFRQMFDQAKEVAQKVNAALFKHPVRLPHNLYPEIVQYAPLPLVLPNSSYALPPQSEPLLPTPAQAVHPSSTTHSSPAANLVHTQEQQCNKTAHLHLKPKVKSIFLGEVLTLLATQYGCWLRKKIPDECTRPPNIWDLFTAAFPNECALYLKQDGANILRLKGALARLIYSKRNEEIEVPKELETKFAEFTKIPSPELKREKKELTTLALQYISWLAQKHKEVFSLKSNIWSVFTQAYSDKCDSFCSKSGLSQKQLKNKFVQAKRLFINRLPKVPEHLENEFEEKVWKEFGACLSS